MSVRPTARLVVRRRRTEHFRADRVRSSFLMVGCRMAWLLVAILGCEQREQTKRSSHGAVRGDVFSSIESRKTSLRNDLDHQAVLEGCRRLASDPSSHGDHEGTDPRLPPALRELSPKRVRVDADHVSVLLVSYGGHLDTALGLSCFKQDPHGEGGEEIAPGLWLWHYWSGEDVTRGGGLGRRPTAP